MFRETGTMCGLRPEPKVSADSIDHRPDEGRWFFCARDSWWKPQKKETPMTDNKHTVPTRYDQAIANNEWLINVEGRSDLSSELAGLYMNKGNVISTSGDQQGALGFYNRALEILDRLVNAEGRSDLANDLAMLYGNIARVASTLGDKHVAAAIYDQAIEIRERLVNVEGRGDLANDLALFYVNKANVVSCLGDNHASAALNNRAAAILERLVDGEGRSDLANSLAMVYFNIANATSDTGDDLAAMSLYDRASEILGHLVCGDGQSESAAGDLSWVRAYRGVALVRLGKIEEGKKEASCAIAVMRAEIQRTGRADLQAGLNWTQRQLGLPGEQR
jgi:tetratricopeptide (TPR) repeat protein